MSELEGDQPPQEVDSMVRYLKALNPGHEVKVWTVGNETYYQVVKPPSDEPPPEPEGRPIYTFALFAIFLYIVSLLVALIYLVAGVRAIVQCRNKEGLGIPKGVKGFGLVVDILVIALFATWYILFGEIAVFSWGSPYG